MLVGLDGPIFSHSFFPVAQDLGWFRCGGCLARDMVMGVPFPSTGGSDAPR